MGASEPMVSVVVATRDRPGDLPATLKTIAEQDFEDFEVIVVDDGSSTETLAHYDEIFGALDERFRVEKPPAPTPWGSGPGTARNRGIRQARGKYVAFCDDDDLWTRNDHLSVAVKSLEATGAEVYFANLTSERAGEVVEDHWFKLELGMEREEKLLDDPPIHRVVFRSALSDLRFPHLDVCVIRRDLLDALGGFWERLRYLEDWDLTFRALDRAKLSIYRPEIVAVHNIPVKAGSASRAISDLERYLVTTLAAQHIKAHVADPYLRKLAGEWEAMYLWRIGRWVLEDGRPDAALGIIAQAALAKPSLRWAPFAAKAIAASIKQRVRGRK